jgi:signal peptide peptidase-like protein 2B
MFCIGAFTSLTSCFDRLSYFVPILRRYQTPFHRFDKPCVFKLGPLNLFTLFAMAVSLTLVIIWYVYRQSDWAWILQDILGASLCITVISIYRLGNMRVITVILVAFFLYDIFFVFITPYIPIFQQSSSSSNSSTSKNPSVMEQVALGIGTNGEVVPLLFSLPLLIPESEMDPCLSERKSMLGFGDVILPVRIFFESSILFLIVFLLGYSINIL